MVLATSERVLVTVHNRHGQVARDRDELRAALLRSPREIPSRFFYDDRGSRLFERITELPEYYQTRTEHALLRAIADRVAAATRASQLVEIGSGAATKTRVLLDAMARAGRLQLYVPVDVAEGTMRRVAEELTAEYPELAVHGVVADFNEDLSLLPQFGPETSSRAGVAAGADGDAGLAGGTGWPAVVGGAGPESGTGWPGVAGSAGAIEGRGRRLVIFLGGTIGNLKPEEARGFLATRRREMSPGDHFLLGVDLVKPVARLEAAYNDAAGITAEFNRNVLRVANHCAMGDFDPAAFRHRAFYDTGPRWIEMRLRSERRQHVRLPAIGLELDLEEGEEIRTEISAKYDRADAFALLAGAGLEPIAWFTDPEQLFGLALARHP
ncbi:MAG TPA: L-histidine N(alpha)-methyltransferase [Thermoanaerobaculia bacterium]